MKLKEIIAILEAELITEEAGPKGEISMVCASDLMSDVLSFSKSNSLLLTSLNNPHTVRTAEMTEIAAVCFVHGKKPLRETVELAQKNRMPLLTSKLSMYSACGRLYEAGLQGCNNIR